MYIPDIVYLSDDDFMVWNIKVEDNIIYTQYTEFDEPQIVAEVLPSESIINKETPFVAYDEKYQDAERIEEMEFGPFKGKFYYLQDESEWGDVNTFVYCINLGDKMAIIEFYPSRGWGGSSRQRDALLFADRIKEVEYEKSCSNMGNMPCIYLNNKWLRGKQ